MSDNNKRIECLDGFSMSVQASRTHYCLPRQDDAKSYTEVEVGYPSEEEEYLTPFAELGATNSLGTKLTEQVYPCVPVEIIDRVIEKHGGVLEGEAPKGVKAVTAKDLWLRHKTELSDCKSFIAMQAREISHLTKRRAY